jgi:hypothetical protein
MRATLRDGHRELSVDQLHWRSPTLIHSVPRIVVEALRVVCDEGGVVIDHAGIS